MLGFTNLNTGSDVGYANNLPQGGKLYLTKLNSNTAYGARASTYSTTGYAQMSVVDG